jgi:hypothetical protein
VDYIEILRDEYQVLRTEICQSIEQQHQIMLGGYGLAAAAAGYIIGAQNADTKSLLIVPFVLIAAMSLWAVECNRMVRASYYIAYILWDKMLNEVGHSSEDEARGWESWIRIESGHAREFGKRQDIFQRIVAVYVPIVLSIAVNAIAWTEIQNFPSWQPIAIMAFIAQTVIWFYISTHIRSVSDLADTKGK